MTRADIAAVIALHPDLSDNGLNTPEARRPEWQADLLDSADSCTRICEWLGPFRRVQPHTETSYGIKHIAEPEIGYVTNGAFIAAVVHLGIPYRRFFDSPNITVGLSRRDLAAARERVGTRIGL